MLAKNHFAIALFAFLLVVPSLEWSFGSKTLLFVSMMFASLLPDLDTPNSLLSRKIFPLNYLGKFFLKHRGILHSFLFWLAISAIIWKFNYVISAGLLSGTFLHIVADSLTEEGTQAFWPLSWRVSGPIKTGSFVETIIFIIFLLGSGILIGRFFV